MTTSLYFFFFNDTATTEIYTLSLHDALPISAQHAMLLHTADPRGGMLADARRIGAERPRLHDRIPGLEIQIAHRRSEEHTSELQSPCNLVCRLLLEKKKKHLYTCHSIKRRRV